MAGSTGSEGNWLETQSARLACWKDVEEFEEFEQHFESQLQLGFSVVGVVWLAVVVT